MKDKITSIICAVLRGDPVDWPGADDVGFYDELWEQAIQSSQSGGRMHYP